MARISASATRLSCRLVTGISRFKMATCGENHSDHANGKARRLDVPHQRFCNLARLPPESSA